MGDPVEDGGREAGRGPDLGETGGSVHYILVVVLVGQDLGVVCAPESHLAVSPCTPTILSSLSAF